MEKGGKFTHILAAGGAALALAGCPENGSTISFESPDQGPISCDTANIAQYYAEQIDDCVANLSGSFEPVPGAESLLGDIRFLDEPMDSHDTTDVLQNETGILAECRRHVGRAALICVAQQANGDECFVFATFPPNNPEAAYSFGRGGRNGNPDGTWTRNGIYDSTEGNLAAFSPGQNVENPQQVCDPTGTNLANYPENVAEFLNESFFGDSNDPNIAASSLQQTMGFTYSGEESVMGWQ